MTQEEYTLYQLKIMISNILKVNIDWITIDTISGVFYILSKERGCIVSQEISENPFYSYFVYYLYIYVKKEDLKNLVEEICLN